MEPQTKTPKEKMEVELIGDDTIRLELHDAIRFPLIHEKARGALKEIHEWLSKGRDYNAHVVLQRKALGLIIEHDISRDVDFCIDACTRRARESGLNPYDVGAACAEDCVVDFKKNTDFDFRIVLSEVKKVFDKYGFSTKIYDKWDVAVKTLVVVTKL